MLEGPIENQQLAKILTLAFPVLPQSPQKALESIVWFCLGGRPVASEKEDKGASPCYNIKQDFGYIWGAFLGQFGIDLSKSNMHWWHFLALLGCLDEDCKFRKIAAVRAISLGEIKDKEQRQRVAKMKKQFALKNAGSVFGDGEERIAGSLEELF